MRRGKIIKVLEGSRMVWIASNPTDASFCSLVGAFIKTLSKDGALGLFKLRVASFSSEC
jgi:hypothetical protein